ncbi:MAG: hypothetical protein ABIX01_11730 [Chitinophagaceae bacterium]
MQYEKYENVEVSPDFIEYEFTSIGPKGEIPKIIQFNTTNNPEIFNLAFGNKKEDGSLDDFAKDDNKDRNKILATVVSVIDLFFSAYPGKWIFFSGSTIERTRLYRMAITINLSELSADFQIFGLLQDMEAFVKVPFEKGVDYFGFLVRKKSINFTE